jgi:hypothetical protein
VTSPATANSLQPHYA